MSIIGLVIKIGESVEIDIDRSVGDGVDRDIGGVVSSGFDVVIWNNDNE